jgi:integrase
MGDGLTLCLEEGGGKTFQARIRRSGDKNARRINIGSFPATSVAEARKRLAEAKSVAREGRDPAVDHRRRRAGIGDVRTVSALVELYLERREEGGTLRVKTVKIETDALRRLQAKLGDRLLADLEPHDIATVVQAEATRLRRAGGSARSANILLAATKRMFKHARGWGILTGPNPAADLARPAQEAPRQRVLHDPVVIPDKKDPNLNETGRLLVALRDTSKTGPLELERETRVAIYVALALGMRAAEVAALARANVVLKTELPTLTIVTSKTKAGERTLPLPTQVVVAFHDLFATADGRRKFVFPARSDAKRAEHLHPESLSRAFARACEKLKIEGASLHDLRRTCLSGITELTGDDAIAERIAGHKGKTTLARHYDRSARLAPMRAALQRRSPGQTRRSSPVTPARSCWAASRSSTVSSSRARRR